MDASISGKKKRRRRGGKRGGKKHQFDSAERQQQRQKLGGQKKPNKKAEKPAATPSSLVATAMAREAVVRANQQISQHAQRKQLQQALSIFEGLVEGGQANSHSYAAMVNAHVRCGDVDGAAKCVAAMKAAGLRPCVVTYTSLLKGYCVNQLDEAWRVLKEMTASRVFPNVRTVNTFLRGCLIAGDVDRGFEAFRTLTSVGVEFSRANAQGGAAQPHKKAKKQQRGTASSSSHAGNLAVADASTFDYTIQLLSHALRLPDAEQLLLLRRKASDATAEQHDKTQGGKGADPDDDGAPQLHVARAAAFLGKWHRCRELLAAAEAAASETADSLQRQPAFHEGGKGVDKEEKSNALGGRRGAKRVADDESRAASDRVFRAHRNEVLVAEASTLRKFLEGHHVHLERSPSETGTSRTGPNAVETSKKEHRKRQRAILLEQESSQGPMVVDLRALYQRTLLFPAPSAPVATSSTLQAKLSESLGFSRYAKVWNSSTKSSVETAGDDASSVPEISEGSLLDDEGFIHFPAIFPAGGPIKIEFGAGTGEWAAAQAAAEQERPRLGGGSGAKANWCSVEVRYDRVASTFSRVALGSSASASSEADAQSKPNLLPNLALVGCDAFLLLQKHIAPRSLDGVFVNYPEPPQQRGGDVELGDAASEGNHMLSERFFQLAHVALQKGGNLTIITDNQWYARVLLRIATTLCAEGSGSSVTAQSSVPSSSSSSSSFPEAVADAPTEPVATSSVSPALDFLSTTSELKRAEKERKKQKKKQKQKESQEKFERPSSSSSATSRPSSNKPRLFRCPRLSTAGGGKKKASSPLQERSFVVHEEVGSARIYLLGAAYEESMAHRELGHATGDASSYFDRLWRRDARMARYCLHLTAE